MASPSPDPLLIGLSAGDERAIALIYEQFGGRLLRTALAMLGRQEDAEDAVQEVFVALVRSRHRLSEVGDMTAYLFAALRHATGRCAARRQKDARLTDCLKKSLPSESDIDPIARREFHQGLQVALEQLPPEQREVVSFRLAGELTFAEIAQTLEVSTQTAVSRYRYALEKLRLLLKEHG
jgi:RNA polymerase sigma-70 factor (ECF subfamily)